MQDGEHARVRPEEGRPQGGSVRPSRPPASRLGVFRLLFAFAWVIAEGALVLTADRRPDGAFGFRMFPESSTITYSLFRELASGERVHVEAGAWRAADAAGYAHAFDWHDRVKRFEMGRFDLEIAASYGAAAQLSRLQAALDDVARHIPDDAETRLLLLDVTIKRNGHEPYTVHLSSIDRRAGGS